MSLATEAAETEDEESTLLVNCSVNLEGSEEVETARFLSEGRKLLRSNLRYLQTK